MDHLKGIVLEERARHLAAHPVGYGHDRHAALRHGSEILPLVDEIAARAVDEQAPRERSALRTAAAVGLPLVAADRRVIIAMACVKPAVVDGPDHLHVAVAQIVEEHRIIQEIPVDVVYVDDVGVDLAQLLHELARGAGGAEAVAVEHTRLEPVETRAPLAADRQDLGSARADAVAPLAVGAPVAPALAHGEGADLLHDAPRRRIGAQHRIDLHDLTGHNFECGILNVEF